MRLPTLARARLHSRNKIRKPQWIIYQLSSPVRSVSGIRDSLVRIVGGHARSCDTPARVRRPCLLLSSRVTAKHRIYLPLTTAPCTRVDTWWRGRRARIAHRRRGRPASGPSRGCRASPRLELRRVHPGHHDRTRAKRSTLWAEGRGKGCMRSRNEGLMGIST